MFKRIIVLAKPHWMLLGVSIFSSVIFVFFNSLSIWLTASFITNILTDFETLLASQERLLTAGERTANETLKMWTNQLILGATPLETLKRLCLSIFSVFVLKNLFLYVKNFCAGLMQLKVITDLRNKLFDHLTSLSLSFFNRTRAGDLTSIVLNDVATMRRTFSVSFQKLLVEPINIITFMTLLFMINWRLTLAAMLILPAAVTLMIWVGGSIRRKAKRSSIQIAGIVSILQEVLGAIRVVKAFVMEQAEKLKFRWETLTFYRLQKRQMGLRLASSPVTEMIGVTMGVILLWLGGQDVLIENSMEPEDFIRFILLLFSILNPIKSLNTVNAEFQTALASAERVYEILDAIADDWYRILRGYSTQIDELEDRVFDPNMKYPNMLQELHVLKQDLREISKSVTPLHEVVSRMMRPDQEYITESCMMYWEDIFDVLTKLKNDVESYNAGAASTRDTYLSQSTMRLAETQAEANDVIRILTILATLMFPITAIASIFGMNIEVFGAPTEMFGFTEILVLMGLTSTLILGFFYYRGWLSR